MLLQSGQQFRDRGAVLVTAFGEFASNDAGLIDQEDDWERDTVGPGSRLEVPFVQDPEGTDRL